MIFTTRKEPWLIMLTCVLFFDGYAQVGLPQPYGSNLARNYVRTWVAKAPQQNPNTMIAGTVSAVTQTTEYSDGWARPLQTVCRQASPLGNDLVIARYYDQYGKEQYTYLPFVATSAATGDNINDGNFKNDPFQQQSAFYNGLLSGQPGEINGSGQNWAYSQHIYEASPLDRVTSSYDPGVNWVGSRNGATPHSQNISFLVNTAADNVQIWNIGSWDVGNPQANIIPVNGGVYPAGSLYKNITVDEAGVQTIQYTDMYGQVVLKKVQLTATADDGTGSGYANWLCTFYVYDDNGKLRFVISPNAVDLMNTSGNWVISVQMADELCSRFEYDNQDQMVVRKVPGTGTGSPTGNTGEEWTVYDQRHRPVMKQNGNMRAAHQWQYIQYDNLDRVIATGLLTDNSHYNDLNYNVSGAQSSGNTSAGISAWPSLASYSDVAVLTQQFYDNYSWVNSTNASTLTGTLETGIGGAGNSGFTTSYNSSPLYALPISQGSMNRGMQTGTKVEVLGGGGQYIYTVRYYDALGKLVQEQNINYTNGRDISTMQYDFAGKVLSQLVSHTQGSTANPQNHNVFTTHTYDAMGRTLAIIKSVSSTLPNNVTVSVSPAKTITAFQYDELGRIKTKTLGSPTLESLTYDYNIKGALLGVNRDYAKTPLSTANYFGFDLAYDKTDITPTGGASIGSYTTSQYNGNLAGMVWKSRGDGVARKFDYAYDNDNRLFSASYTENSSVNAWNNNYLDFSMNGLSYDYNGNITALVRKGFLVGGSQIIDNLAYSYINGNEAGNRLQNVTDISPYNTSTPNTTLGDFHYNGSKTTTSVDYSYDNDGNITSDFNRSITGIQYYNYINLPQLVTFSNGKTIQYVYSASGIKLQKIVTENGATVNMGGSSYTTNIVTKTTYVSGFVYKTLSYSNTALFTLQYNDVLQFVDHEAGRIRFIPASVMATASFVFDYFITDHLGNIRMVLTDENQADVFPAATLETVTYNNGTAEANEQQFYSINTNDIVPVSGLNWWSSATNNSYNNENNNGNPPNNNIYSNVTANSANVYQLCGNTSLNTSGDRFGLGITIKVMAGDKISIYGKSAYNLGVGQTIPSGSFPVTDVLSSLLTAFANSSPVAAGSHGLTGSSIGGAGTTLSQLQGIINNANTPSDPTLIPKAGINWILFDDQFRPVTSSGGSGFDPVSSTGNTIKTHTALLNIPMVQNGYLYVFCSNESNINVYFDNLQVVNSKGPIAEDTHYYPFGLIMAGISDKAWNKQVNNFHYNGNELQSQEFSDGTGLDEYDFNARYYDQQLGRFAQVDPAANSEGQESLSPYQFCSNNPVLLSDPNGKWFGLDDIIVSAVGFVAGYVSYGLTKDNWGGKALLSGLVGAVVAEGSYLTFGGGLATASSALPAEEGASTAEIAASQVTATTGFAGTLGAAKSFAFNYATTDAFTIFSNYSQIHSASDWRAFGLIAGYSLMSSISAGFGSKWTEVKIDKMVGVGEDAFLPGATANAEGSFISSFGNGILSNYDPVHNTWKANAVGSAFRDAFLKGAFGSIIGNVFKEVAPDNIFINFKAEWLQNLSDKYLPTVIGKGVTELNSLFWSWAYTHL